MSKSESQIQSEIMVALSAAGHKVFRANAGQVKNANTGTWLKLLPKGFPDVFGWRAADGKFFGIEVKNLKGKLRPDQEKFAEFAMKQPIIYGVAKSVDEAIKIIEGEN